MFPLHAVTEWFSWLMGKPIPNIGVLLPLFQLQQNVTFMISTYGLREFAYLVLR